GIKNYTEVKAENSIEDHMKVEDLVKMKADELIEAEAKNS
ncbi:25672_t:CDS:1, partial [Racocetra persica]